MKFDMNDTRTPRERIGESLLRRNMEESRADDCCDHPHIGVTRDGRPLTDCRGMRHAMPTAARPEMHMGHCGGEGYSGWGLHDHPLAMAYAPLQVWRDVYDPETGLCRGTQFAQLDLPFGGDWTRGGNHYGK